MNFVNERERGNLPLSIGTSLAFESLLNRHSEVKHLKNPYETYRVIWVNLKTLYRNIHTAIKRENIDRTSDTQFKEAMLSEMHNIQDICQSEANGMGVVFYISHYRGLTSINSEVLPRMDNTSLQKIFTDRMMQCIRLVIQEINTSDKPNDPNRIRIYENKITDIERNSALIFTSYAYDLISFRQFNRLGLLETFTGKIKERNLWYTKYQNGSKLPEMPFRLDLLTLLGDTSLFRCKVSKFRTILIELANNHHWTAITTKDKIRENISTIKDHEARFRLLNCIKD